MTIWALGKVGANARFIEASNPSDILGYMEKGDECAPVSMEDKNAGGTLQGPMVFVRAGSGAEL